jgi:hypothetical protein
MPETNKLKTVVIHKANGTTFSYNRVTEILSESPYGICFTDEKFGRVSIGGSALSWQVKHNPLAMTEERAQA